jgi:hypothetical protein
MGMALTPLKVLFQIYVMDFAFFRADAERQTPVAGDGETPCAFAVADEHMHF